MTRTSDNHTMEYRIRELDMRIVIEENKMKEKLLLRRKTKDLGDETN